MIMKYLGSFILLLAAGWIILNLVSAPDRFFTVLLFGLGNGALYALIALGYTLVYGIIELINFAHGDLFMLGTVFSSYLVVKWFGVTEPSGRNWLLLIVSLLAIMLLCGVINMLVERLAYRRLRHAPKLAPLITAVGVSFIFQWFGTVLNGSSQLQWPSAIPTGGIRLGDVTLLWSTLVLIGVTVPLLLALTYLVQRTRQGRAMRATAQDQDASLLMGININRTIAMTFLLGGAMAGAAGVLFFETVGSTRYDLGFQLGLVAFTAAVLGGIGNLTGAVVGGVIIGLIQAFTEGLPYGLGQRWSQTVVFAILILLMVFKPEGIFGKPAVEKV
jgi:branched-chain amino acid transport system permease protein